jgi:MSHA pilin protein MshD
MCITRIRISPRKRQTGFTLVELIMSMIVVGVGVAALLVALTSVTRSNADPLLTKQMIASAEAMLEEIELKPFAGTFAGPYTQANRQQFDAVLDYNGFATAGIYAADGAAPVAGLGGYNVAVAVAPSALGAIPAASAYLISVTVTGPNGTSVTLSAYRTSYF